MAAFCKYSICGCQVEFNGQNKTLMGQKFNTLSCNLLSIRAACFYMTGILYLTLKFGGTDKTDKT